MVLDTAPSVSAALAALKYWQSMGLPTTTQTATAAVLSWQWPSEPMDAHVARSKMIMGVSDTQFLNAVAVWVGTTLKMDRTVMVVLYDQTVSLTSAREYVQAIAKSLECGHATEIILPATCVAPLMSLFDPSTAPETDFKRMYAFTDVCYTEMYVIESGARVFSVPSCADAMFDVGVCRGCDDMYGQCSVCFDLGTCMDEIMACKRQVELSELLVFRFGVFVPRGHFDGSVSVYEELTQMHVGWIETDFGTFLFGTFIEYVRQYLVEKFHVTHVTPLSETTFCNVFAKMAQFNKVGYGPHRQNSVVSSSHGIQTAATGCLCRQCFNNYGSRWRIVREEFAALMGMISFTCEKITNWLPEGYVLAYFETVSLLKTVNDMSSYFFTFTYSAQQFMQHYFDEENAADLTSRMCEYARRCYIGELIDPVEHAQWMAEFDQRPMVIVGGKLYFNADGALLISYGPVETDESQQYIGEQVEIESESDTEAAGGAESDSSSQF